MGDRFRTHGMSSRGGGIYKIWNGIVERCENTKHPAFATYGGRGIRICEQWRHDFAAFLAHVGPRPSPKHSIDRINGNGNYEPGNVRWATSKEQNNNRRDVRLFAFEGQTASIAEWARRIGGCYQRIYHRIVRKGEPVDHVLDEERRPRP